MYRPEELEVVLGTALAKWSEATGYRKALPPVWLREMSGLVKEYWKRVSAQGEVDRDAFEADVYKLITCFAVGFLKEAK